MTTFRLSPLTTLSIATVVALSPVLRAHAQETSSGSGQETQEGSSTAEAEAGAEGKETEKTEGEEGKRKLSDRIKAVERKAFIKKSRVEIFPQFALDLNDPFFQHMLVG